MGLVVYDEKKMQLSPIEFVRDIPNHKGVIEMDSYELKKQVGILFTTQALAYGIKEEITSLTKTEIYQLILRRFKRLSINEMYYAFQLHRSNDLGAEIQPYGQISVSFVAKILDAYVEWKRKMRQVNNIELPQNTVDQQVSEEEKRQYIISGVLRAYKEYQEYKLLPAGSAYIYDVLYDINLLPKDSKIKRDYYEKAKKSLEVQINLDRTSMGVTLSELRELKTMLDGLEKKNNSHVKIEAMKLVVCDYFKQTKKEELESILNQKL